MVQAAPSRRRRPPGGDHGDQGSPSGLLERQRELKALAALLESTRHGQGGLVVVEGAAGLGKSRLLRWVVDDAKRLDVETFTARSDEPERDFSFGVALQLFERWLATADERARGQALAGAAALASPLFDRQHWGRIEPPGEQSMEGVLHGLFWLVTNLSERGPLLLAIDDVQWSDPASLQFLSYLVQRLEDLPVALVIGRRPLDDEDRLVGELAHHRLARPLALEPLSEQATTALLKLRLDRDLEPRFAQACFVASGGNPFMVEAIAQAVDEDRLEPDDANARAIAELRPQVLGQHVLVRISRLGSDAATFASAASVLGDQALIAHVAALACLSPDASARAADALLGAGILSSSAPVSFSHSLLRSAVYEEIAPAQRARMHVRAARLLHDEHRPSEAVAAQLLPATRVGEPWAAERLRQAADRGLQSGNPEAAIRYLARALREPLGREERAGVLLDVARAQATIGDSAAEAHLHEALALIDDPRDEALAHKTLGSVLYARSDQAGAAKAFEQGLEALGDSDDPLARDLHAAYFSAASLIPELAPRALAHIAPILERAPGGETTAERGALAGAAVHLAVSGGPRDQAISLAYRAWGDGQLLAEEGPDGWGWSLVTGAFEWTGESEASLKVSGLVIQEAVRRGSLMAHATASFTAVEPAHMLGRLNEACAHAQTALAAREFGWRTYAAALTANYAAVLIDQGELGAAERELEAVNDPAYGTPAGRAWARAIRGRLRLLQGRPQEALEDLRSAGELLGAIAGPNEWWTHWRTDAAVAAHQLGHHDYAQELVSRAAQIAQTTTTPSHLAHVLRARARLEPDNTIDLLERTVQTLEGSQALTESIRSRVELGAALRRANQRAEARRLLSDAREQAHMIGAWGIERQAHEELRVAGARPRRLSFSGADSLTASQRRVAEMAAQGLANREIAQTLFVTPRTVEQHLYNAYKKLGIQSRSELSRALAGPRADSQDRSHSR